MSRVSAFFLTHVPAYPSLSFHFNNLDSKQSCSQGGFNPVKDLSGSAGVRLVSSTGCKQFSRPTCSQWVIGSHIATISWEDDVC